METRQYLPIGYSLREQKLTEGVFASADGTSILVEPWAKAHEVQVHSENVELAWFLGPRSLPGRFYMPKLRTYIGPGDMDLQGEQLTHINNTTPRMSEVVVTNNQESVRYLSGHTSHAADLNLIAYRSDQDVDVVPSSLEFLAALRLLSPPPATLKSLDVCFATDLPGLTSKIEHVGILYSDVGDRELDHLLGLNISSLLVGYPKGVSEHPVWRKLHTLRTTEAHPLLSHAFPTLEVLESVESARPILTHILANRHLFPRLRQFVVHDWDPETLVDAAKSVGVEIIDAVYRFDRLPFALDTLVAPYFLHFRRHLEHLG